MQQIGEVIGHGACGKVFKGLNFQTGQLVAIKQISLNHIKEDRKGQIKMEINLLKKLEHPKIVKYFDSILTDDYLNIVLEYVENGSLDSLIKKFGNIPETLVVIYIQQVLQGLEYLHSEGVIHRDIKGGNILTTKDGEVKLADFSVAIMLKQEQNNSLQSKNISFAGTPYWMAPEVIQEKAKVTSACDIWSLGCTVIELLTGKPPYYDFDNPFTAMIKIVYEKNPPIPEHFSPELKDFLSYCFEKDPEKRIDAKGLLKHKWLCRIDKNALQKIIQNEKNIKLPKELTSTIQMHLDTNDIVPGSDISSSQNNKQLQSQQIVNQNLSTKNKNAQKLNKFPPQHQQQQDPTSNNMRSSSKSQKQIPPVKPQKVQIEMKDIFNQLDNSEKKSKNLKQRKDSELSNQVVEFLFEQLLEQQQQSADSFQQKEEIGQEFQEQFDSFGKFQNIDTVTLASPQVLVPQLGNIAQDKVGSLRSPQNKKIIVNQFQNSLAQSKVNDKKQLIGKAIHVQQVTKATNIINPMTPETNKIGSSLRQIIGGGETANRTQKNSIQTVQSASTQGGQNNLINQIHLPMSQQQQKSQKQNQLLSPDSKLDRQQQAGPQNKYKQVKTNPPIEESSSPLVVSIQPQNKMLVAQQQIIIASQISSDEDDASSQQQQQSSLNSDEDQQLLDENLHQIQMNQGLNIFGQPSSNGAIQEQVQYFQIMDNNFPNLKNIEIIQREQQHQQQNHDELKTQNNNNTRIGSSSNFSMDKHHQSLQSNQQSKQKLIKKQVIQKRDNSASLAPNGFQQQNQSNSSIIVDYQSLIQQITEIFDNQFKIIYSEVNKIQQNQYEITSENNFIFIQYQNLSSALTDKIRQLLQFLKNYDSDSSEQIEGDADGNTGQQNAIEFRLSQSKITLFQIKKNIMQQVSPLRLIEMLSYSPLNCEQYLLNQINLIDQIQFATMQLINQICDDVPENYNLICLSGIVVHLKKFTKDQFSRGKRNVKNQINQKSPHEIKVEVAYFILKAYVTSNEAVMMIFASQGYKILSQFLTITEYEENKLLIFMAIDVFLLHFDQSIQNVLLPQCEIAQIFAKENVSKKLGRIFNKLIDSIQNQNDSIGDISVEEEDNQMISLKYVDKTFDLLQYLQNGNDQTKLDFCSKELIYECLVKHVYLQIRQPTQLSMQILRRFIKLIHCLLQGNFPQKLFKKLYDFRVVPCLVEILKFFFNDIQRIQLTLVYDNLKVLSLLCSHSQEQTLQATLSGILPALKKLTMHIKNLGGANKFSQNKKIKLQKLVLTIIQDNIKNEITRNELIKNEMHLMMIDIMRSSNAMIVKYFNQKNQNQNNSSQIDLCNQKIDKEHEVNYMILEIFEFWFQYNQNIEVKVFSQIEQFEREFFDSDRDFLNVIFSICKIQGANQNQIMFYQKYLQLLKYSKLIFIQFFKLDNKYMPQLLLSIKQTINQIQNLITQIIQENQVNLQSKQKKGQKRILHHYHAKSSPNFILSNGDQQSANIDQQEIQKVLKECALYKKLVQILITLIQMLQVLFAKCFDKKYYEEYDCYLTLLHNEESHDPYSRKLHNTHLEAGENNSIDDEHLETDIIDDEEDEGLDQNIKKIKQINLFNSKATSNKLKNKPQQQLQQEADGDQATTKQQQFKINDITHIQKQIDFLRCIQNYIQFEQKIFLCDLLENNKETNEEDDTEQDGDHQDQKDQLDFIKFIRYIMNFYFFSLDGADSISDKLKNECIKLIDYYHQIQKGIDEKIFLIDKLQGQSLYDQYYDNSQYSLKQKYHQVIKNNQIQANIKSQQVIQSGTVAQRVKNKSQNIVIQQASRHFNQKSDFLTKSIEGGNPQVTIFSGANNLFNLQTDSVQQKKQVDQIDSTQHQNFQQQRDLNLLKYVNEERSKSIFQINQNQIIIQNLGTNTGSEAGPMRQMQKANQQLVNPQIIQQQRQQQRVYQRNEKRNEIYQNQQAEGVSNSQQFVQMDQNFNQSIHQSQQSDNNNQQQKTQKKSLNQNQKQSAQVNALKLRSGGNKMVAKTGIEPKKRAENSSLIQFDALAQQKNRQNYIVTSVDQQYEKLLGEHNITASDFVSMSQFCQINQRPVVTEPARGYSRGQYILLQPNHKNSQLYVLEDQEADEDDNEAVLKPEQLNLNYESFLYEKSRKKGQRGGVQVDYQY